MKTKTMMVALIVTLVSMYAVYAAEPGGATVTSSQDLGEFSAGSAGTVSIEAGNVTQANLEANMSTYRWSGLLGNVSGSIQLGDGSSNVLFTWTGSGRLVYASEASPTWGSLADASQANVEGVYTHLATGSDNYSLTFTGGSESIGSGIFTLSSDFATTLSSGATTWKTYSLWDTTNVVFAGRVESAGTSYSGTTVDYQMIIPEDGTAGDTTATTWNLYAELV